MSDKIFYKKDGNISSIRTTVKVGKNRIRFSNYFGKNNGVTFKAGNLTTRLNNKGQCIGFGLSNGNNTTYFGKNGNVTYKLTPLK